MSRYRTKDKIITASELLFSKHGIKDTTMRKITQLSETNLASVNYHFGSKEKLTFYIFDKMFNEFSDILEERYKQISFLSKKEIHISLLLEMIVESIVKLNIEKKYSYRLMYRLIEWFFSSDILNSRINYVYYLNRVSFVVDDIKSQLIFLDESEINWRLKFIVGSLLFMLSSSNEVSSFRKNITPDGEDLMKVVPLLTSALVSSSTKYNDFKLFNA